MKKVSFALSFAILTSYAAYAQLDAKIEISNDSELISDGRAQVIVEQGVPPYTYKWSNQSTPLDSDISTRLSEGISFNVLITDAEGSQKLLTGIVPAESPEEKINSLFLPLVNGIATILFWDPFEATGIYDPVVFATQSDVIAKGFQAAEINRIFLQQWYQPSGSLVQKGEKIALIRRNTNDTLTIFASGTGVLTHRFGTGELVYNSDDLAARTAPGTGVIGNIKFESPVALSHPNGDPQKKSIPFIVLWLVFGATFFTLKMGFVNFRGVKQALLLIRGKYDNPNDSGEVSHFQALTTALSATVGLGNIAGVAVAIVIGGAGATFWMIVAGLLGMASKFTECTLGVKYRKINEKGVVSGGPMFYLSQGLANRNMKGFGKVLAVLFAILCVGGSFGGGNMFQANQAFAQASSKIEFFQGNGALFGVILAILVALVILGGIKSIARVTDKIVPLMVGLYVGFAVIIILMNIENIGHAFSSIFAGAFAPSALKGGVIGVLIVGFQRAAFSNEAGVGSASIAHAASRTEEPVSEGIVALLEPFVDTVVVCTMTALVLIFTGFADNTGGLTGTELTSAAFSSVFGWFDWVLLIAILLFAFSTMVSWSYYGLKAWTYLFGHSRRTEFTYKALFLVFIVIGSSVGLGSVLDFSDLMILGMAFPNILGLLIMSGEVKKDLNTYFSKLKSGAIKRFK
jgi:AGCS family alanine or glycine:cation symporter